MRRLTSAALIAANYMIFFSVMFLLSTCWERKKGLSHSVELTSHCLIIHFLLTIYLWYWTTADLKLLHLSLSEDWKHLWHHVLQLQGKKPSVRVRYWDAPEVKHQHLCVMTCPHCLSLCVSTVFCLIKTNVFVKYWDTKNEFFYLGSCPSPSLGGLIKHL